MYFNLLPLQIIRKASEENKKAFPVPLSITNVFASTFHLIITNLDFQRHYFRVCLTLYTTHKSCSSNKHKKLKLKRQKFFFTNFVFILIFYTGYVTSDNERDIIENATHNTFAKQTWISMLEISRFAL
jgi:hypothetical protein